MKKINIRQMTVGQHSVLHIEMAKGNLEGLSTILGSKVSVPKFPLGSPGPTRILIH